MTALALIGAAALAGCDAPPAKVPVSVAASPAPRPQVAARSPESLEIEAHFKRVQASLLTSGLLRRDGGGPDTPFDAPTLARNFIQIALYQEYSERGGRLVAGQAPSVLHRWEQPLRYRVTFGASVPAGQRKVDTKSIAGFSRRLARLTGVSISKARSDPNFHIFVVNEDERRALAPSLRAIEPGISPATLAAAVNMARDTYCLAFASDPQDDGTYERAIVIIRAEHPDLLRLSCVHEELAQAMGLANDSPRARPSIFNDDEEFGLLTTHDELLLRMLYDRRLRPGMTEAEARPIVETIATELIGGEV